MTKQDIDKIRKAVCKNEGGFDNESDETIMSVWNLLTPERKEVYMESIKSKTDEPKKEVSHADRDKPELDIPLHTGK